MELCGILGINKKIEDFQDKDEVINFVDHIKRKFNRYLMKKIKLRYKLNINRLREMDTKKFFKLLNNNCQTSLSSLRVDLEVCETPDSKGIVEVAKESFIDFL